MTTVETLPDIVELQADPIVDQSDVPALIVAAESLLVNRSTPNKWNRCLVAGLCLSLVIHLTILYSLTKWIFSPEEVRSGSDVQAFLNESEDPGDFDELSTEPIEFDEIPESGAPAGPPTDEIDVQGVLVDLANQARATPDAALPSLGSLNELMGGKPGGGRSGRGGAGLMRSATFFGLKAAGDRFVFVVDNSASMARAGRFKKAIDELMHAVSGLDEKQEFYVIFFSDRPYPLFFPTSPKNLIPATEENIAKLEAWIRIVDLRLRTDARESMELGFRLKPDAIFLLTDGEFTDDTQRFLMKRQIKYPVINTVGLEVGQSVAGRRLQAIAKEYKGSYRLVSDRAKK